MNKLFPMPLLGQFTAEIESLPSYVLRLAFEHGASVGAFITAISEMSGRDGCLHSSGIVGRDGIVALSRVNNYSNRLRLLLSELTGQNLFCGALQFLERHVYQVSNDIGTIRWCPECFSEMSRINAPRYIKQLWHMKVISHCPLHRTPLVTVCPHCESEQFSMKAEVPLGWCMKCGFSLAERRRPLSVEDIQPPGECMAFDLVEIFSKTARDPEEQYSSATSRVFSSELLDGLSKLLNWGRVPYIAAQAKKKMLETHRSYWRLISLRRLAYMMNMSLYEMLSRPFDVLRLPYDGVDVKDLPDQIKVRKKIARNHEKEYQKVLLILEGQSSPPSLKQLARLAKVSVGYLEYRFPGLVRNVVDSYHAYVDQQYLKRRYRAQTAALEFFISDRYAAHAQSRKEAYRVLREETGLPKWLLKDAIQVAYRAIYDRA